MQSVKRPSRMKQIFETPLCKPFRFSELVILFICFVLLFFQRQFEYADDVILHPAALIFFFTVVGSTLFVTFLDVFFQMIRRPIPNSPMILSLILGCVLCFVSAIISLVIYSRHYGYENLRNLTALGILSAFCFFGSLMYFLDVLIVIRFACR